MIAAWLITLPLLALVPALIAQRKGQGFWTYYVFGLLAWIVAVPVAPTRKDLRPRCPECREVVRPDATRCRHCHADLAVAA